MIAQRLHPIDRGPGNTSCPHCGRPDLVFRRPNSQGDVYTCCACGERCVHLEGRHFHGVWGQRHGGAEVSAVCVVFLPAPAVLVGGCDAGGFVTASRQISSVLRSPGPCPDCLRRGMVYGRLTCANCRARLLLDLGENAAIALLRKFKAPQMTEVAVELRRLFGYQR